MLENGENRRASRHSREGDTEDTTMTRPGSTLSRLGLIAALALGSLGAAGTAAAESQPAATSKPAATSHATTMLRAPIGDPAPADTREPLGEATFLNPIKVGADPSIFQDNGSYWFVETVADKGIALRHTSTITGLGDSERRQIWQAPASGPLCCEIWAPELLKIRGDWYIYFAADNGDNANHRMYAIKALTADPFGPWSDPVKISDSTDRWAIDATVMETPAGRLYFLWSGWEGTTNVSQQLYIAPMSDPLTISGPRVEISRPTESWERNGTPYINEGPEVLQKDGKTFVVYSASGSWTNDYCLGMLTNTSGNLLDPAAWTKSNGCVFAKRSTAQGPGHHTFTKSPDGTEDWLLYHANTVVNSGWDGRTIRAQKFTWDANGSPVFGAPTSTFDQIPVPSGETGPRYVSYEAEDAQINQARVVNVTVPGASGAKKVGYMDFADSHVQFAVDAPETGRYDVLVRYANGGSANNATIGSTQFLSVNGGAAATVSYPQRTWDNWTFLTVPMDLQAGTNTVRFTKGSGFTEMDMIRVPMPIAALPTPSTTTVTVPSTAVTAGSPASLTVQVATEGSTPTGTVTIRETGGGVLGSGTLTAGRTTIDLGVLPVGNHTVAATYSGDGQVAPSTSSSTGLPVYFVDVPATRDFAADIMWAATVGVTVGHTDGTFRPTEQISRQALIRMIYAAAHDGDRAPACTVAPYADVPVTSAFCGEIAWAKTTAVTTGYDDNTFRPGTVVSRQATAAFLHRTLHPNAQAPACTTRPFTDVTVGSAFCGEIAWAAGLGIVRGYPDGSFHPGSAVNRDAAAAFLHRAFAPAP
ncbi:hypothetical protein D1871_22830 [Nakamurella silvestris]|nr:hypothetical protein D1871_22830 [Nakamurella silvestris]